MLPSLTPNSQLLTSIDLRQSFSYPHKPIHQYPDLLIGIASVLHPSGKIPMLLLIFLVAFNRERDNWQQIFGIGENSFVDHGFYLFIRVLTGAFTAVVGLMPQEEICYLRPKILWIGNSRWFF